MARNKISESYEGKRKEQIEWTIMIIIALALLALISGDPPQL